MTDPASNVVDQWMALLGFERQTDLAAAIGRSKTGPSQWRRENLIPAPVVLALQNIALERGLAVPPNLLRPRGEAFAARAAVEAA